ncbi:hypothetical protein TRIATDRAFT_302721 [Trichoderma atroviride IMI 206040]|uniref:Uncharacterized protein n=1 Tax=Hypocrea atroviridis (strain ATCC 20476 / IMI 206040) TaxID=452589 RepID=G9P9M3_HYPAI|nr:uncharacterized protein TRIATDRAFT_302721 [Trichoderma atroviride IMI 206040]EHK40345.1 hypothetical protein TRIATDRAFT_302721 [Trichoderma atroviride IMI 206040]
MLKLQVVSIETYGYTGLLYIRINGGKPNTKGACFSTLTASLVLMFSIHLQTSQASAIVGRFMAQFVSRTLWLCKAQAQSQF